MRKKNTEELGRDKEVTKWVLFERRIKAQLNYIKEHYISYLALALISFLILLSFALSFGPFASVINEDSGAIFELSLYELAGGVNNEVVVAGANAYYVFILIFLFIGYALNFAYSLMLLISPRKGVVKIFMMVLSFFFISVALVLALVSRHASSLEVPNSFSHYAWYYFVMIFINIFIELLILCFIIYAALSYKNEQKY